MTTPATKRVMAALGSQARFVGGAVRDTLLGRKIGDIDIATPLLPDEVLRCLAASRIRALPTGLAHGTVTAVTAERHYEITSLRRDVETFGRRAKVAFTADWLEDSRRRDFTMNAMYLGADGSLFDYHHGLRDLLSGNVRFVGDPATRIAEDVLRLLRFYRFHAWYGRGAPDRGARAACRAAAPLIATLSGERVRAEMLKLLAAPDPVPALALMAEDGVLERVVPAARPVAALRRLIRIENKPDALRRLGALVAGSADDLARRLKLSNIDRERLLGMAEPIDLAAPAAAQRRLLYRLGRDAYIDRVLVSAAASGAVRPVKALLQRAARWRPVVFPLKGRDVTALGVAEGKEVGRLLGEIEAWWEARDFRDSRGACLAELRRRVKARASYP